MTLDELAEKARNLSLGIQRGEIRDPTSVRKRLRKWADELKDEREL